jgi:hypothetical protein
LKHAAAILAVFAGLSTPVLAGSSPDAQTERAIRGAVFVAEFSDRCPQELPSNVVAAAKALLAKFDQKYPDDVYTARALGHIIVTGDQGQLAATCAKMRAGFGRFAK